MRDKGRFDCRVLFVLVLMALAFVACSEGSKSKELSSDGDEEIDYSGSSENLCIVKVNIDECYCKAIQGISRDGHWVVARVDFTDVNISEGSCRDGKWVDEVNGEARAEWTFSVKEILMKGDPVPKELTYAKAYSSAFGPKNWIENMMNSGESQVVFMYPTFDGYKFLCSEADEEYGIIDAIAFEPPYDPENYHSKDCYGSVVGGNVDVFLTVVETRRDQEPLEKWDREKFYALLENCKAEAREAGADEFICDDHFYEIPGDYDTFE